MNRLRVLVLAERFWPIVGGHATLVQLLAQGLHAVGDDVTIVTLKQVAHWPDRFLFREVPVVRLPEAGAGRWSSWRAARDLKRWLVETSREWDAIFVAVTAPGWLSAVRYATAGRILIHAEYGETRPIIDARWLQRRRGRSMGNENFDHPGHSPNRACWEMVVQTTGHRDALVARGIPQERIHLLRPGVPLPSEVTHQRKSQARGVLAAANPDLSAPRSAVVGLYAGAFRAEANLEELVRAWKRVAACIPNAQLWLVGDGPERLRLWQQVRDEGLTGRVVLPGTFEDASDLYAAADFFVMPGSAREVPWPMLESLAHGLPAIAVDSPLYREVLPQVLYPYLADSPSEMALANSILRLLDRPDRRPALGAMCRQHIREHFAWSQMVGRFRELCSPRIASTKELPAALNEPC